MKLPDKEMDVARFARFRFLARGAAWMIVILAMGGAGAKECRAQSARTDVLDPRALPLGDGRVSTEPSRGRTLYSRSRVWAASAASRATACRSMQLHVSARRPDLRNLPLTG
jgi:hypothetical protein